MNRCVSCQGISACPTCGISVSGFDHIGVRASNGSGQVQAAPRSGLWHYARPCGHKAKVPAAQASVKYNGGPLWKNSYSWQNVYWGPYFASSTSSAWIARLEKATVDIESDKSYSGGLSQYNVGIGRVMPFTIVKTAPSTGL